MSSVTKKNNIFNFLLTTKNARLLWIGRLNTFFAEQLYEIALVWLSWEITHSSTAVSIVVFATRMPLWALGWLTGIYVDRYQKRHILIFTSLMSAIATLLISVLYGLNILSLNTIVIIIFSSTAFRTMDYPALVAQLPTLAPEECYYMLNSILDNTKRIARFLSPLLAAALQGIVPIANYFLLVSGAYVLMAYCVARFDVKEDISTQKTAIQPTANLLSDLRSGIAVLKANSLLLHIFICFALYNITYASCMWILLPRLSGVEKAGGIGGYSLSIAAFNLGGITANLLLSNLRIRDNALAVLFGFLTVGCSYAALPLVGATWLVMIVLFIAGSGLPLMDMSIIALINSLVVKEHQGRIFAFFRYFAEAGLGVGLLLSGVMADRLGVQTTMIILGLWVVPLVIFFFILTRQERKRISAT